jgi:hypothetical protein
MSNLDNISGWKIASKEVLTQIRGSEFAINEYQDNAFNPPVDLSRKSTYLNTPIGDRYIKFYYRDQTQTDPTGLYNESGFINDTFNKTFLLEDPIITISRPRKIVQTSVNGLDGDIVEIISDGTYYINIVGTVAGSKFWDYNNELIIDLEVVAKYKETLNVINPYLNDIFSISGVVITDHKVAQSSEFTNIIAIEINCVAILNEDIFYNEIIETNGI